MNEKKIRAEAKKELLNELEEWIALQVDPYAGYLDVTKKEMERWIAKKRKEVKE